MCKGQGVVGVGRRIMAVPLGGREPAVVRSTESLSIDAFIGLSDAGFVGLLQLGEGLVRMGGSFVWQICGCLAVWLFVHAESNIQSFGRIAAGILSTGDKDVSCQSSSDFGEQLVMCSSLAPWHILPGVPVRWLRCSHATGKIPTTTEYAPRKSDRSVRNNHSPYFQL